ncbi:hypothetical protein RUM43_005699 [Polyplax serrata]|uniref:RING-type domain-containing protein n=1 Tax=Polyplax serrata TaxID=468196 RepID=A0AAN8NWH9_POLSC
MFNPTVRVPEKGNFKDDNKFCCRKCQILTARPLNRNELLNLRSRDLVNYLASRHISTNGCVEKEDLVNVLMRAVNNSCFHPLSNPLEGSSSASSCPNTPRNQPYSRSHTNPKLRISHSAENLFNEDGIRIRGHDASEDDFPNSQSAKSQPTENLIEELNEPGQSSNITGVDRDRSSHTLGTGDISIEPASEGPVESNNLENLITELNEPGQSSNVTGVDGDRCSHIFGTTGTSIEPASEVPVESNNMEDADDTNYNLPRNKPLMLCDIKSINDLEALSVKQLKELLSRNRTDFKGCIERAELLQKAIRLWSDYVESRKDLDNLSLDELCKICMDAPIECVLLECGHMATCTTCGKQLCECPICRQFVVRCVRTFKA